MRMTYDEEIRMLKERSASGCDVEYILGRISGLISSLYFMGQVSELEAIEMRTVARETAFPPKHGG